MINRNTFLKLTTLASLGVSTETYGFLNKKNNLPKVLILGDSISIGYFPFVKKKLLNKADISRPMLLNGGFENCEGTTKGVENISKWIGDTSWDLIHFNFGLHDIKHVDLITGKNSKSFDDPHQAPPNQYRKNLNKIVKVLKKTKAKLVFATTTPYPDSNLKPARKPGMYKIYNEIAIRVMKKNKIEINDLNSFVLPRMSELQRPYNVHFSKYGSSELAKVVIKSILQNL